MKQENRGFSLAEALVALSILAALVGLTTINMGGQRGRASSKALASLVEQELRQARSLAQRSGRPVAVVFPSANGTRPHSDGFYLVTGYDKGKVERSVSFANENSQAQAAVASWTTTGTGPATLNTEPAPNGQIDLDNWLPTSLGRDFVFLFLPDGSLQTNDLTSFDDAYHIVATSGIEYSGASAPSGTATMTSSPSYFSCSKVGDPYTISIQSTGEITTSPGLFKVSGVGLVSSSFTPTVPPASASPASSIVNQNPVFDDIVLAPRPNPLVVTGVDAQLEPEEHLTLTVTATDPNGDELFCEWTSPTGSFSSPGPTRMVWDEQARTRKAVWVWQPPHDALVGDPFTLTCRVFDPDGGIAAPIVGSIINGVTEPESRFYYVRTAGAERHIYTCKDDGSGERRLTNNDKIYREVHVSWDSSRIAYTVKDEPADRYRIEVSNLDGSNPRTVRALPGENLEWARLNPQGTVLIHNRNVGADVEQWYVNIDGTNPRVAIDMFLGEDRWASWSGDGTQIAVLTRSAATNTDRVRVHSVDPAADFATVGPPTDIAVQPGSDFHYVEWQPAVDPYLLILDRQDPPNCFYVRASNPADRIDLPPTPTTGSASIGCWSPDGSQILYGTRNDGLYVIDFGDTTGATRQKVIDGPIDFPVWR